jgi:DNA-directed RNA polymerase subunit RPC12/RpoP
MKRDFFVKEFPSVFAEWNFIKNKEDPNIITSGSHKKVWWKCKNGHEWLSVIKTRTLLKHGCPYCSGRYVTSLNCLSVTHPDLVKEWHPTKNKDLTPDMVSYASGRKIWWLGKCGHKWKSCLAKRTTRLDGCPYCNHKKICKKRSLSYLYPDLCLELHPTKNKLDPNKIFAHSHKKTWWLCKKCGNEWIAVINQRHKTKCPACSFKSKGETFIKQIFDKYHFLYQHQFRIDKCRNKKPLPFDFVIFFKNKFFLIEYQGEGHYSSVRVRGMSKKYAEDAFHSRIENDKIKKDYCLENKIPLLCIPYWEKTNSEKLILEFIQKK